MIKQFENFAPISLHKRVKEQLLSPMLDWHFPGYAGYEYNLTNACFAKQPFNASTQVEDWANVNSLIYVLDWWIESNKDWFKFSHLDRCLINFYTAGQNTGWHIDRPEHNCFSLLYYVNDADGGTEFKDKKILHCENNGVFFNSNLQHSPITSTVPRRITVNWLLFGTVTV